MLVSTLAGSGEQGNDDGAGTAASFDGPTGITVNPVQNDELIVADTGNHIIRTVTRTGGTVKTIAGNGELGSADSAADPLAASFSRPRAVVCDATGSIYVADTGSHKIRKIIRENGQFKGVSTIAGSTEGFADGDGTAAQFKSPQGLAISTDGKKLFVADTGNRRIRMIDLEAAAKPVTTVAGSGASGGNDGTGNVATFYEPVALTFDGFAVLVIDKVDARIRKIFGNFASSSTTEVLAYVGHDDRGLAEGDLSAARYDFGPAGGAIFSGPRFSFFIAETGNQRIRLHTDQFGSRTLAGSGSRANATAFGGSGQVGGDPVPGGFKDGPATIGAAADLAKFNNPQGVVYFGDGATGTVYVADTGNHRIRKFSANDLPNPNAN